MRIRLRRRSSADPIATWGGLTLVIAGSVGLFLLVRDVGMTWQPATALVVAFVGATILSLDR